jgi:hypothetical protein
MVDCVDIVV